MEGVIYIRVSSEEQVAGTSLAHQEDICRRYAAALGITQPLVFRDEGQSAKTTARAGLLRALAHCRERKGHIEAFIVAKVDRLARNTEDHLHVRRLLNDLGIRLHSVSEPIGDSPAQKFVETILAAGAEFDNAVRTQRSTDGMAGRIKQGIWPFRPPVGYLPPGTKRRGEKKTVPDIPDPVLFPILAKALKAYADGTISSPTDFARRLDSWGFAAARGLPTRIQLVERILGFQLSYFSGLLINPWSGETVKGLHVPMISEGDATRIRLIRAGRLSPRTGPRASTNPDFPLCKTIRCSHCARWFTGGVSKGKRKRYAYYFCGNPACPGRKVIPRREIHAAFVRNLATTVPPAIPWDAFELYIRDSWSARTALAQRATSKAAQRLATLKRVRARIFEMREDGSYTVAMFHERLADSDLAIAEAERQCATAPDHERFGVDRGLKAARWFHSIPLDLWLALPQPSRRRLDNLIFPGGLELSAANDIRTPEPWPMFAVLQKDFASISPLGSQGIEIFNTTLLYLRGIIELHDSLEA